MKSIILDAQKKEKNALLEECKKNILENQAQCNSCVTIIEDATTKKETSSLLSNIPYVLKDNFSTKGIETTASSNTLKNYIPPYDATVYDRLNQTGAILLAKTVMDEFGMGGTGTTGHTGTVKNPWNLECIAGGSSAGSAAAVASGAVPFAIGSDTGDSVRKPAAYCGIVGYKPTYGLISRYGLIPFASSLDHVGILTKYVQDAAIVANEIKGIDSHDMTSWDSSQIELPSQLEKDISGKKLFYIKEIVDIENYQNPTEELRIILNQFQEVLKSLQELGAVVESKSISKDLLETLPSVYTCISSAEATSNLSNLTGIIYGPRGEGKTIEEIIVNHRTNGFSPLIKRRLIIGSYVLQKENQEKYFENAQRVRNQIVTIMHSFFKEYDACILPCAASIAPKIANANDEMKQDFAVLENHMVIGNFGGFPSITIPSSIVSNMPIGINLTAEQKEDEKLLNIACKLEEKLNFKGGL